MVKGLQNVLVPRGDFSFQKEMSDRNILCLLCICESVELPWTCISLTHEDVLCLCVITHVWPWPFLINKDVLEPSYNDLKFPVKNRNYVCCCCSVAESSQTLCNPMDCSTPGFPVSHYLLEFAQTHVHWVDDAMQSSHPLLLPSPPALNLSQHHGLF